MRCHISTIAIAVRCVATQALLSILMNTDVELGEILSDFKDFASVLGSMDIPIGSRDGIRAVHNSFSRPEHVP